MADREKVVRVVPIVLDGGRIIENRGEETNTYKVEYEDTFTEHFDEQNDMKVTPNKRLTEQELVRKNNRNSVNRIIPINLESSTSSKAEDQKNAFRNIASTILNSKDSKTFLPLKPPQPIRKAKIQNQIMKQNDATNRNLFEKRVKLENFEDNKEDENPKRKISKVLQQDNKIRSLTRREQSLQDLDLIWSELQELDKLPTQEEKDKTPNTEQRLLVRPKSATGRFNDLWKSNNSPSPQRNTTVNRSFRTSTPKQLSTSCNSPKLSIKSVSITPIPTHGPHTSNAPERTSFSDYSQEKSTKNEFSQKSKSLPRTRTVWPENYDRILYKQEKYANNKESEAYMKTESQINNYRTSRSPSTNTESPNDFQYFNKEYNDETKSSNYEWMDFKKNSGGKIRGTIVNSAAMKDKNCKNPKDEHVPKKILRGITKEGTDQSNQFLDTEESIDIKIADKSIETNSLSYGSDASTQTYISSKKIRCEIM